MEKLPSESSTLVIVLSRHAELSLIAALLPYSLVRNAEFAPTSARKLMRELPADMNKRIKEYPWSNYTLFFNPAVLRSIISHALPY